MAIVRYKPYYSEVFPGWTEDYLNFRDTHLWKAALQFVRRYNIEVSFDEPALKDVRRKRLRAESADPCLAEDKL